MKGVSGLPDLIVFKVLQGDLVHPLQLVMQIFPKSFDDLCSIQPGQDNVSLTPTDHHKIAYQTV